MDSEHKHENHATKNENDGRHYHRPKRRRMRWGRLFLLLVVLAVLLTSVFWGSVWVYQNILHAPEKKTVAADTNIAKDETLNKRINVLLLGIDDGDSEADGSEPKRTDAMIVASFYLNGVRLALLIFKDAAGVFFSAVMGFHDFFHLMEAALQRGPGDIRRAAINVVLCLQVSGGTSETLTLSFSREVSVEQAALYEGSAVAADNACSGDGAAL